MEKILIPLIAVIILGIFVTFINQFGPDHTETNSDKKEISIIPNNATEEITELKRKIGIYGTEFIAKLQIKDNSAALVKGYAKGPTGAKFSIFGQNVGFGISGDEYWVEESSDEDVKIYKVYVNFKRIVMLLHTEQKTLLVGKLILSINR